MNAEDKIKKLGIDLTHPAAPVANYVPAVRTGNLVYLSGKGPTQSDGTMMSGKVGSDLDIDQGYEAARLVGIQLLAGLKEHLGDLNRVSQVVKVLGMVNSSPDFQDHPKVINPASEILSTVFGDKGKHARVAIGANSLPLDAAVEIDAIFEID